ncbi:AAA family ATPase [Lujinxingia vulgaris]|uniref:AAA family ATPase n=1 Tax=Lujinxingia vulgaris TaxID=2600176 RepID=A0A5C6XHE2_9DELT|nr:AAA family ATPase [Lujinxingia vulgaris]TXD38265.1 AAA family ATPase [Lujinxingia vulgaris]
MRVRSYRLEEAQQTTLGGRLWKAVDESSGRTLELRAAHTADAPAGMLQMYRRQAQGAAAIFHSGVAPLYDFGEVTLEEAGACQGALLAGDAFWVSAPMEGGQPLQECMGRLEWPQFRQVLLRMLEALAFGHARGVVHRRLSPELVSVRLGEEDEVEAVQLLEFGLLPPRRLDGENSMISAYQAPEVVEGRWREQGAWSDLYSVGVIAFEWLYGRLPDNERGRPSRGEQHHFVPSGFASWVLSCMDESPIDRFRYAADARQVLSALDVHFWGPPRGAVRREMGWRRDEVVDLGEFRELWRSEELYRFREVPLVGREEARDALWERLAEVHQGGRSQVMVLRGPSGAGKTRLMAWLARRAHELGLAEVMRATHSPVASSADGLSRMFSRYFRATGLSNEGARRRVFEELSGRGLEEVQAQAAAEALASWMLPWNERSRLPAGGANRAAAMQLALGELGRERPLLICVEDGQWASETLDWVERVLESPLRVSVMVVITLNDEALVDRPIEMVQVDQLLEREGVDELTIPPLSLAEQLSFISMLAPLEEELAYELAQRAGGNPMFIVRMLMRWVHEGLLVASERHADQLALKPGARATLPEGMLEAWDEGVEQLIAQFDAEVRDDARRAMECAAALGLTVMHEEWLEVCERCDVTVPEHLLQALLANRLVAEHYEERSFEFVHPMLREALARRARAEGRYVAIHRACADVVKGRAREEDVTTAERLGMHLFEAGENDEAMEHLLRGCQLAGNLGESRRALGLIARYEQACDRLEIGEHDVRRLRGMLRQSWALQAAGQMDAAEPVVARARALLKPEDEGELLAPLLWLESSLAFARGDFEKAEHILLEARDACQGEDRRSALAGTMLRLASAWSERGELQKAVEGYASARDIWRELEEIGGQAVATMGLATAYLQVGEAERASALMEEVRGDAELFARVSPGSFYNMYGEIFREQRRWEDAEAMYLEAISRWEDVMAAESNIARSNLGMMMVSQRRFSEAMVLLSEAEGAWSRAGMVREQIYTLSGLLPCLAASGSWTVWREYAGAVEGYVRANGMQASDLREMFEVNVTVARESGDAEIIAISERLLQTQAEPLVEAEAVKG